MSKTFKCDHDVLGTSCGRTFDTARSLGRHKQAIHGVLGAKRQIKRTAKASDTASPGAGAGAGPITLSDAILALEVKRDAMTETIAILKTMNGDQT